MTHGARPYIHAHQPGQRLHTAVLTRLAHDELTPRQLASRLGVALSTAQSVVLRLQRAGLVECVGLDDTGKRWRALPAARR